MKLCNFKSTTTNDYIRQTASLLGRALLLSAISGPSPPLQLKPAPGAPTDPHQEANRFHDGMPASPVD